MMLINDVLFCKECGELIKFENGIPQGVENIDYENGNYWLCLKCFATEMTKAIERTKLK